MTQDQRWDTQYEQLMAFMTENHRRPSKHRVEEHLMLNWFKHNKKLMASGSMPVDRIEKFKILMDTANLYRRRNQYM